MITNYGCRTRRDSTSTGTRSWWSNRERVPLERRRQSNQEDQVRAGCVRGVRRTARTATAVGAIRIVCQRATLYSGR
jgi:hypothetical protein